MWTFTILAPSFIKDIVLSSGSTQCDGFSLEKELEETSFCHVGMCPLSAIVDGTKAPFKVSLLISVKYGSTFSPACDPSASQELLQRSHLQPSLCLLDDP